MSSEERFVQPITPAECIEAEKHTVPQESIVAINGLLAALGRQREYMFEYNQVVDAIVAQGVDRRQLHPLYAGNYLRFAALFEDFGWNVVYKDLIPNDRDDSHMVYIFTPKSQSDDTRP